MGPSDSAQPLNSILESLGHFLKFGTLPGLALLALLCWFLAGCYRRIPAPHREISPGKAWLLMIPCFNVVWNFRVYPGLSRSFRSYFDSIGDTTVGDCQAGVARWYCIATACCLVPVLNLIAAPSSLVLLIVYLLRVQALKAKIKTP
jgi:hypothetical protein